MEIGGKIIKPSDTVMNSLRKYIPNIDTAVIVETNDGKIYVLLNPVPTKDNNQCFNVDKTETIEFSSNISFDKHDSNFSQLCQNMTNWINAMK